MSREEHDHLSTADLVAGTDTSTRNEERLPAADRPQRSTIEHEEGVEPQQMRGMQDEASQDRGSHDMQWNGAPAREQPMQGAGVPGTAPRRDEPTGTTAMPAGSQQMEQLAALFTPEVSADFRNRWDQVQIGFVDDPRQAVQHADELVAQVMKSLASNFAEQRSRLEAGLGQGDQANTENLRMALRSYRSFFERLLSL